METLIEQNADFRRVLEDIINGCVHPETAARRVLLDLTPIRQVLEKHKNPLTQINPLIK